LLWKRRKVPVCTGQGHELGKGAQLGEPWLLLGLTDGRLAAAAFTTGAARKDERYGHSIPYAESSHACPDLVDEATHLVARRERLAIMACKPVDDVRVVAFPAMPVAAANTCRLDLQKRAPPSVWVVIIRTLES